MNLHVSPRHDISERISISSSLSNLLILTGSRRNGTRVDGNEIRNV